MVDALTLGLLAAAALFAIFGATYFFSKEGIFSTYLVYAIGIFIYLILIPAELWLRGETGYTKGGHYVEIGQDIPYILAQAFLALPAFFFGLIFGGYRRLEEPRISVSEQHELSKCHLALLALLLTAFCVLYSDNLKEETASYFNVAGLVHANPLYALLKYTLLLVTAFLGARLCIERKLYGWLLIALPCVVGWYTHDKNPVLMSLIATGVALSPRIRSASIALFGLIASVPLIFILLILVRSFSYLRADYGFLQSTAMALEELSFTRIDPAGPFISIAYYIDGARGYIGETYLDNIALMIPRFLYPDRPVDLGEAFARSQILDWQEGQGLGFSPLAEAFLNFGQFAFVHFFILGVIWALIWRAIYTLWRVALPPQAFVTFYKVFGFYLLMLCFRSTSLHFFKIVPLYAITGILALACIGLVRLRK